MFRPRIIPMLLLSDGGLVKTIRFSMPRYIGDPVNAIRIFSSKGADELTLLDIDATTRGSITSTDLVSQISDETFMPFGVGGGIRTVKDAQALLKAGAEKVVINTAAVDNPGLVGELARQFGSQSVVVSIDAKRSLGGNYRVYTHGGRTKTPLSPADWAVKAQEKGAGEILLTSVDQDGMMAGYDIDLVRSVAQALDIPVIAAGGAGSLQDFARAIHDGGATGAAAGSLFVFHGARRAVLISYPSRAEVEQVLGGERLLQA